MAWRARPVPALRLAYKTSVDRLAVDQNIATNKPATLLVVPSAESNAQLDLPPHVVPYHGTWFKCQICNLTLNSVLMMREHAGGKRHLRTVILAGLRKHRSELLKDKCGIKVVCENQEKSTGGVIDLTVNIEKGKKTSVPVTVRNTEKTDLYLYNMAFLKDRPFYKLVSTEKPTPLMPRIVIAPGAEFSFEVKGALKRIGRYNTTLVLRFRRAAQPVDIHILRDIRTRVVNSIVLESDPTEKYIPSSRVSYIPANLEVIDGTRPKIGRRDTLEKKLELKNYAIPKALRAAVNHGLPVKYKDQSVVVEANRIRLLMERKNPEESFKEYHSHHSTLLHMEELQMEVDIRTYDMTGITMTRNGKLLELRVPGLAENRPSVLRGDHILVRILGSNGVPEDTEYRGYVHVVQLESVLLGFSNKLLSKFIDNMKFNVRFTFNRLPLKLQHRSTELAFELNLKDLIFPQRNTVCRWGTITDPDRKLSFCDKNIERNNEQATAVRHIVAGSSRPAPYLIFGPPGTGKTVTVVESIKQVLRCNPKAHILACAPSNSAADLITQRVAKEGQIRKDIFRMHAASRNWKDVPEDIKDISNYDKADGDYYFPSIDEICKKKVVVTTMVTAGRLATASFPPNHFTHVFIDEAGHAFESEAIIPIAGILECDKMMNKDGAQLVLAGDPKQLGPIVRSPFAKAFGLDISLLERLMETSEPYGRRPQEACHYDPRLITKLVDNYRSHPAILELPNRLFYDGELNVCADKLIRESLCKWDELPKKDFPIIFHGIVGGEKREGRSPSFFNPEEISVVHDYIVKLLTDRKIMKLKETDIGVIAPYRQQVVKIRKALQKRNYKDIKVGSVEEFQGQERKVVIISAVRSSAEYLEEDAKFKLGFLANKKKYNVATTRAKSLMIVVGNPEILQLDPENCWNQLIDFCQINGAYKGYEYTPLDTEVDELRKALSELKLDFSSGVPEMSMSGVQNQVHPEWRSSDRT
ncbi:putative helicase MOV-10 [Lineus longissimus]|uniref:putative helicase MOV-10 n=1 Tax=Lineus longissimus TaxID=88925 RepID=UPI002B4DE4C9